MYAIIADGNHQYRVEEGQILEVQIKDLPEGTKTYSFDRVLLLGDVEGGPKIGQPTVSGAKVTASIIGEFRGDKIKIQKFRRRKGYCVRTGHRQDLMEVKIDKIQA